MMFDLPLPCEIQNLVAAYLNPIFNYVEYTSTIKKYNQAVQHFEGLCTQQKKQALVKINREKKQDLVEKLEEKYEIIIISPQQLRYLNKIDQFILNNPKFRRPVLRKNSTIHYRRQFDVYYTAANMARLESNLKITRGIWQTPGEHRSINIINDINVLHKEGTLLDLSFACLINNVGDIVEEFEDYMLNELYLNTSIQTVKERYYVWFCSKWRWKNGADYPDLKYRHERQHFIQLLMEL